jgi:hypothetical protein
VNAGQQLLAASAAYQNQHIMGWGADNPEPVPGVYNWASLDRRVELMRESRGVPVLTLCCAPDWMKGGEPGTTDWSKLEVAPLPEHYSDFAELSKQVALRYPDVSFFQVWNELKGFYDLKMNRWRYEDYTQMYNLVYDAVRSVRPDTRIGGPYVVMDSWSDTGAGGWPARDPSLYNQSWGTADQRPLDVISYWLANKHGAEFITIDAGCATRDGQHNGFDGIPKFVALTHWISKRTSLPLWWAEWYCTPWGRTEWDHAKQNAVMSTVLSQMLKSGTTIPLRWQPQGTADASYNGDIESVWSDTRVLGGGQPFPFYESLRAFRESFGSGTAIYGVNSSSPDVEVLASAARTLVVNKRSTPVRVSINGSMISMTAYQVLITATPN